MFEKIYTVSIFIVQTERKQGEVGRHELFHCVGAWRNGSLHRGAGKYEMIFEKCYSFHNYHLGKSKYFEAEFNQ